MGGTVEAGGGRAGGGETVPEGKGRGVIEGVQLRLREGAAVQERAGEEGEGGGEGPDRVQCEDDQGEGEGGDGQVQGRQGEGTEGTGGGKEERAGGAGGHAQGQGERAAGGDRVPQENEDESGQGRQIVVTIQCFNQVHLPYSLIL